MHEPTVRWTILQVVLLAASAAGALLVYALFLRRGAVALRRDRAAMRRFWLLVVAVLALPALGSALGLLSTLIQDPLR